MNEFALIQQFFNQHPVQRPDVVRSIGDDCAIVTVPFDKQLAISTDTLVSGVHFFPDMPAIDLGYKALAVNLSDLAATGATPAWALLALTLPKANTTWLQAFSQGFFELAERYHVALIGGDTTRGPLTITVHIHGFVSPRCALTRSGAKPGDEIYVTGTLGDAGLGLQLLQTPAAHPQRDYFISRLYRPTPRVEAGQALCHLASAAIDISDGLAADLTHILERSQVGATLFATQLPLTGEHTHENILRALTAGDDYELCFTVPSEKKPLLLQAMKALNCPITCIGYIDDKHTLTVLDEHQQIFPLTSKGFDHFTSQ